ncbi:MAG: DUF4136 domain-containing protein [Pseudomonadales bacterium]|nr:DUF4136 domain-containing protein [Pseudomonadales bacterium]MCP5215190.1 DUF4136 domain-containing protein [Pseudomonadales bacterium]
MHKFANLIKLYSPRLFTCLLIGLFLSGCATIKSGSHQDESVSFTDYRTFSWIADNPLILGVGESSSVSPLTLRKISEAIKNELIVKGFVFTENQHAADFVLSFTVGTREKINASSYPSPYSGAWGWHYYETDVVHRTYTEGTLSVDIFDGKTKQPVWHGWATKIILTPDREDPSALIKEAVTAIFNKFDEAK